MAVPEGAGGAGATLLDLALAVEALGRRLAPAPLTEHAVAARLLARVDALSAEVVEGSRIATLALRPVRDRVARLVPAGAVAATGVPSDRAGLLAGDGEAAGAVPHPPPAPPPPPAPHRARRGAARA